VTAERVAARQNRVVTGFFFNPTISDLIKPALRFLQDLYDLLISPLDRDRLL